jgi:hypothetical protein
LENTAQCTAAVLLLPLLLLVRPKLPLLLLPLLVRPKLLLLLLTCMLQHDEHV